MLEHQDQAMSQAASLSMSDQALHQMFEQFLLYQAANTTSKAKSKHTANPEIFSGDGRNTELMHEKLEGFITALNLKMALNADCYPTEVSQIAYVFSHTSGTTQTYISAKISADQYSNWNQVVQDLRNTFADPDPEFHAQKKLLNIHQMNWPFAAFFTNFNWYTPHSGLNDKGLKLLLCVAISEELAKQLVSFNLKEITYQKLVKECQLQDNQLCATSDNAHHPHQAPSVAQATKPHQESSPFCLAFSKLAFMPRLPSPLMDLSQSKLTPEEWEQ